MSLMLNDWTPGDPELASTLPSRYFYDREVFEAEQRKVFMPAWHVAGHASELAEPGQFVTVGILDQSILVVCGRDGVVRAFHNVCQHRGTRLVEARRGKAAAVFTCPYHAWAYGFDGGLRSAPRCERLAGFDKAENGLRPVALQRFAGFWFVNLDAEAASPADSFAGAEAEIRRHCPDLDDLAFHSENDFIVPANWKVIMDNAIEGYHFELSGPVHKALADLIRFDQYSLTARGAWWTFVGPPKGGRSHAFGEPIDGAQWQTDWFFNIALWPHMIFYCFPYADFYGTFLMIPLEPEKTLLRLGYYVPRRDLSKVTLACMDWMNNQLGPEDIALNVAVQKGLRSLGFNQGRYMIDAERSNESEHLVHHFHSRVHEALCA